MTESLYPLPLLKEPPKRRLQTTQLPRQLIGAVLVISLLPFFLNLLGVNFASDHFSLQQQGLSNFHSGELENLLHRTLSGSFVHTILEWSAFCAAIFTVVLAFAYFSIKHDVTTPIIGTALLCAGIMDAFHTLVADRLLETAADQSNLIPFTWAICRLCNALLTLVGVSLFLLGHPKRWTGNTAFVVLTSLGFGMLSYGIIHLCATSSHLPETVFPNSWLTRPWDVIPLLLFLIAGIFVYPQFYQRYPSLFSHSLIISTIPNIATQVHMAFGSTALFDNHFNIAHFLKIVAYLVPLTGLILDYINTHQAIKQSNFSLSQEIEERRQAQKMLEESERKERLKSQELQSALKELQYTQSQLIQSEKMSSLGQLVAGVAHEINNPVNFIHGNIHHADQYTQDLLELVSLYQGYCPQVNSEIQQKVEEIDLEFLKEDLPHLLSSMKLGADRIRDIVKALRVFSRLDEAEVKDVDIHEGIDSTLMILHNRLKAKPDSPEIKVIKEYGKLPVIQCYAGQLNQVFMNVLGNAIDALEEVNIHRTYQEIKDNPSQITIRTSVLNHQKIQIQILDNGSGMPESIRQQIFDPFFTTKPVGKGTGLGMSISYQIVTEKHRGTLECFSTPGVGTEFVIQIPIRQ